MLNPNRNPITFAVVTSGVTRLANIEIFRLKVPLALFLGSLAELLRNIERSLDRRGYDLALKIPDSDYLGVSQLHRLRQIVARWKRYSGGFIIPTDPAAPNDELRALCRTVPYPIVFVDNTGEFARRRARDIVQRRLAEFADSSRPGPDGHITTIVGVDGTREARALIDAGSLLRATVVQDPTRLAESAVDLMECLIRGEDVPRHNLLPIHLYSAG